MEEINKSDVLRIEVTEITETYIPLANSTYKIFFSITNHANIYYLYQFSLTFLMETIYNLLSRNEAF